MIPTAPISSRQAWLLAIRPRTLPAAVSPVLVGTALAIRDETFHALPALAALIGALLLQIGVNLANDYFDFARGVDTAERVGPVRVTQSGLIPPEQVRFGMVAVLVLSALVGIYLIYVGGLPILLIGVASIISALAYSGGPFPLASHGLGDLFVFIFFGLAAVCGTYYVQSHTLPLRVVIAAIPIGLLITAVLVVNNLRDIETDRRAGKRTLAVMLGPRGTRAEYTLLLSVAYLIPLVLWLTGNLSMWAVLPWLTLPLGMSLIRAVLQTSGPSLNRTLAQTAQLGLLFSVLFSIGIVL